MSQSDDNVEVATSAPVPSGVVESSVGQWLLVDANRWRLAGFLSLAVFAVVFALGWFEIISVTTEDPAVLLLSVLIGGNVTLVTIVISINQLVLSREFGKPHSLRERDEGVRQLREDLRDLTDAEAITPTPEGFLAALSGTLQKEGDRVVSAVREAGAPELREHVDTLEAQIDASTDRLDRRIEAAEFGSFELMSAMLRINSAWLLANVIHLREERPAGVSAEPFDRLEETFRLFNVARQYTKTLYIQKEIAALSRLILYLGFAALVALSAAMLAYGSSVLAALPQVAVLTSFSFVIALAFAPIAFLLSYVLRLSTIVSFEPLRNPFITDG